MLPLTFSDPGDYDKVQPSDKVSLLDLKNLTPGKVREVLDNGVITVALIACGM